MYFWLYFHIAQIFKNRSERYPENVSTSWERSHEDLWDKVYSLCMGLLFNQINLNYEMFIFRKKKFPMFTELD